MFRKLLFLIILAGIGFGIYTGINKAMDAFHVQKDPVFQTSSWMILKTWSVSSVEMGSSRSADSIPANTGFFSRIWTNIKTWFWSKETNISWTIVLPIQSTEDMFSWELFSWTLLSWTTTSSTDIDRFKEFTESYDNSWDVVSVIKPEITPSIATGTTKITNTKTPVITPKKTTTSDVDPILDALF